jgi:hypothetical protein
LRSIYVLPGIIPIPKGWLLFGGLFLFFSSPPAYPRGKTETPEEKKPLNNEWVLCVTAFDVSTLSPSQRIIGDVLVRSLLNSLETVDHRIRVSREYAYYEDVAWFKARSEAGKKLATKRQERDLLLYQGHDEWKYLKDLKALEEAIKTLEEELKKAETDEPLITEEPDFRFTEGNVTGTFPAPPPAGGEYRFCSAQKADAFLTGAVTEFHGRIFLSLRMYVVYTRNYEYEDSIIFSSEDTNVAVEELVGHLIAAVSGAPPAAIAISAEPDNATILLKESFVGQGKTGVIEHPPGPVEVTVFADDYETVSQSLDIHSGELADLYINLKPISLAAFGVNVPGKPGTLVYRGALYLGEAPYVLNVPAGQYEYLQVESPGGETASIVFRGVDGTAELKPVMPHDPEEKRTGKSRRRFYGAYGRLWFAVPVAYVLYGMASAHKEDYERNPTQSQYERAQTFNYVSLGTMIAAGIVLTETFYRIFRYVHTSGEDAVSIKNRGW